MGAGYATGQPAAEIEKFVTGIDWAAVIGGVGRRTLEPIEQKRLAIDAGSKLQMGLIDGKIVTPSGLADASSIDDLLRAYVARARTVSDFDKLPIPFRAVATDMMTGDMVVLDHGDIATAMRASMAIPGAFSPVVLDPWILSDGGMVRNIPDRRRPQHLRRRRDRRQPRGTCRRRAKSWCRRSSSCRAAWT